jgi:hypothetical protein
MAKGTRVRLIRVWLKSFDGLGNDDLARIATESGLIVDAKGVDCGEHYAMCQTEYTKLWTPESLFQKIAKSAKAVKEHFKLDAYIVDCTDPKYQYGEDDEWWEHYTMVYGPDKYAEDGKETPLNKVERRMDQYLEDLMTLADKDEKEVLQPFVADLKALNKEILHGEHEPAGYVYEMLFDKTSFQRSAKIFVRQLDDVADNISFAYGVEGHPGECIHRLNDIAETIERLVA